MGIIAHAPIPTGCKSREFTPQHAIGVKDFLGAITLHPLLEDTDMFGMVHVTHWNLVASPVTLAFLAIDFWRASPSLGRSQNDHWPGRTAAFKPGSTRISPDLVDLGDYPIERL